MYNCKINLYEIIKVLDGIIFMDFHLGCKHITIKRYNGYVITLIKNLYTKQLVFDKNKNVHYDSKWGDLKTSV